MIDRNFCEQIEYKICEVFRKLDNENTKGFWCDGVLLSESETCYKSKFINDNRKIKLKAFVGKDGQNEYELTLLFSSKSLSKVARQLDFIDTFPRDNFDTKFAIDTEQRKIEIQLD
jgi:hypothetical protein